MPRGRRAGERGEVMTEVVHHDDRAMWVHRAWLSLLLFVLSFGASFYVGEGLAAAYGHPTLEVDQPPWVGIAAGLPALAVFAAPLLLTWRLARRAGDAPGARAPVMTGAFLVMLFLAQGALSWIDVLG